MSRENRRVPTWMLAIIIISMLPVVMFPWLLSNMNAETLAENKVLVWLYPVYALTAGYLAWQCYGRRSEMSWILIILLWLSHAGIWLLASEPVIFD